jgi:hypothetical protein
MKNIRIVLCIAALAGIITSCNFMGKHTTIVETGNNYYLKIEYAGKVRFNDDGTGIGSISRGGYVRYWNNEKTLIAKNDGYGGVKYELDDNGEKLDPKTNGKALIAEAVRVMMKKGHKPGN